jgi:hypothetical protein
MAAQTARFISFETVEEQYLAPLPSAEERWKKTQVILRKLERDWKERLIRRKLQQKRKRRKRLRLGLRLLALMP